jgi:hypothetical protein
MINAAAAKAGLSIGAYLRTLALGTASQAAWRDSAVAQIECIPPNSETR